MSDIVNLNVALPFELHQRTVRLRKRLRTSATQLIREALTERVEFYEAKFRAEEETKRAEQDAKKGRVRSLRSLVGTQPSKLAPTGPAPLEKALDEKIEEAPIENPLQHLYVEHARRVFEVLNQPYERMVRAREALAAIKKAAPLTHPLDADILRMLEQEVLKLKVAAPPPTATVPALLAPPPETTGDRVTRFIHDLLGKNVDTTRVRTSGDVEE